MYHGHLSTEEWHQLLRESKFIIGLGECVLFFHKRYNSARLISHSRCKNDERAVCASPGPFPNYQRLAIPGSQEQAVGVVWNTSMNRIEQVFSIARSLDAMGGISGFLKQSLEHAAANDNGSLVVHGGSSSRQGRCDGSRVFALIVVP